MEIKALSTPNWHFIVSSMQQSKVIDQSHRLGSLGYPLVIKRGWEIPELLMVDSWDNHQQMMGGTHCHV